MKKLLFFIALLFALVNVQAQTTTPKVDIGINVTGCADFEVVLKPTVDLTSTTITNVQFTIKWPAAVDLSNIDSTYYSISQQGNAVSVGGFKYATFVGITWPNINWTSGTEIVILTFSHTQTVTTGTTTGDFIIMPNDDGQATTQNVFYVEELGSNVTSSIFAGAIGVDLGKPTITLGSNPAVCSGTTSADLSYTATTFSPDQYSIDWDGTAEGEGFSDVSDATLSGTPITLTVPAGAIPGTYNGTLTVSKSLNGCESNGYPITVTVYSLPAALNLTGSSICTLPGGNGTVLSSTSETGVSYQLYDGSNNTVQSQQSGTGSGLNWSNLTAGTGYYVIGTNGNSCTSTSNSVDVSTYPNPTCSITGNDGPVCPGSSNVYTAPAGMSNYAWSISGNGSISGSASNQTVTVIAGTNCNQAFTLSIDITDDNGCSSTCDKIMNVNDTQIPVITLLGDATVNICQGTPYNDAGATATDNCEGDITASIVTFGDVIDVNTPGTYYVTYDVADACGNNAVQVERTVIIEATAFAGTLAKTPDATTIVESYSVSAVLTAGTGGNGVDELEFSTDEGSTWLTYTSGDPISTTGLIEVQIRTRRMADYCTPSSYTTVSWTVQSALQYVIDNTVLSSVDGTIDDMTATFPPDIPPVIVNDPYKINSRMTLSGDPIPAGSTVSISITVNGTGPMPYVTDAPIPSSPFWVTDLFDPAATPADFDAGYGGRFEVYNITINSAGGNPLELNGQVLVESIISEDGFTTNTVLDDITLDFTIPPDEAAALAWLQDNTVLSSVSTTIDDMTATFPPADPGIPPVIVDEDYLINSRMTLSGDPMPAGSTVSILITVNGTGPMPYVTDVTIPASPFWVTDLFDPAATPADFDAGYGGRIEVYNITINGPCTNPADVNGQVLIESIISKDGFTTNTVLDDISLNFTILATPVLAITDPDAVCDPNTVDLTDAAVTDGSTWPIGTAITYWEDAGATIALANPDAVAASGTYYIKATSTVGCFDIDPVDVTIYALPNNSSDGFAGNSVCLGEIGMLTFDALNSTFVGTYTIEYTDGTTTWSQVITDPGAFSFAVAVNPIETTSYSLVSITNGNGCERTSGFGDATAEITIYDLPVISLAASNVNHGQTLTIDATVNGGTGPYTYEWTGPNGYTGSTEDVSIANAQPVNSGTYILTVTDDHGCYATESVDVIVYGTDLYVNDAVDDGNEYWCIGATGDDNNPGTTSAPLLTLTQALAVAIPGDKIWVDVGTYTENIVVDKELIFQGAGATNTILVAGSGIAIEVTADNVTVDGFAISHTSVTDLLDMGIRLNQSDFTTIQNNLFTMNSLGIMLLDAGDNTIYQNEFAYNAIGIYLEGTTDGEGNFDVGSNGPFYSLSLNNNIELNNIHHSVLIGEEGGQGIYVDAACESNDFLTNTVINNDAIGYYAWKASNNTLTGNTFSNNGSEGIQLMGSSGNTITDNTIANNTNYGMWIRSGALSSTGNTITDNTINGNGTGILLNDDEETNGYIGVVSGNTISDNKIYSNTHGLLTLQSPTGVIYDATSNWWGDASGPYNANNNSCGTANDVADNVSVCLWYTNVAMTPTYLNGCVTQEYTVTGGGEYCDGGIGLPVGLDGSEMGVNYQLYLGGSPVGSPVAGDGNAISFGDQVNAGTYTVLADNIYTGCTDVPMTGNVSIIVNLLPTAPTQVNVTVTYDGTSHSADATVGEGETVDWYTTETGSIPSSAPTATYSGVFTAWAEARNETTGCISANRTEVTLTISRVSLDLTVMLQGPYDGGTMNTDLYDNGFFPTDQPFNTGPWNYSGSESATPTSTTVDWVLVELRSDESTLVARSAGILNSDGSLSVSIDDGVYPGVHSGDDYYIVVWHRNHMPIMSASAQTMPVASYDLTDAANLFGADPAIDLGSGVYGMIAGDVTVNGRLQYSGPGNDRGPIIAQIIDEGGTDINSTVSDGYWYEDVNMDNTLSYIPGPNDRGIIIANINDLIGSELNNIYLSVVPGAVTGAKNESTNDGFFDLSLSQLYTNANVEITNNELLLDGLVDNIQFTLAWNKGDNEIADLLNTFSSDFMLSPQGEPKEVEGVMHQVFASITPVNLPSTLVEGDKVTVMSFENSSGINLTDRLWIADDEFTSDNNGMYYVSVWGNDNTGNILTSSLGVGTQTAKGVVQLYPNPVYNGKLNIQVGTEQDEMLDVFVYNLHGKLIKQLEYQVYGNDFNRTTLDVSTLSPGAYLLTIEGDAVTFRDMFIVR